MRSDKSNQFFNLIYLRVVDIYKTEINKDARKLKYKIEFDNYKYKLLPEKYQFALSILVRFITEIL